MQLGSLLVVFGWILVIGGILEIFGFLRYGWPDPWWPSYRYHALLMGPIVHIGLGLVMWALSRR